MAGGSGTLMREDTTMGSPPAPDDHHGGPPGAPQSPPRAGPAGACSADEAPLAALAGERLAAPGASGSCAAALPPSRAPVPAR